MKKSLFYTIVAVFLSTIAYMPIKSETTYTIYGTIVDKENGQPIPGATIKVTGTKKGTYSSTKGKFRLPFLEGKTKLKVMSIGYETKFVNVDEHSDTLIIEMKSSPVLLQGATVVGNIEPSEIIKRAIERKNDNQAKLKTFKGLLYSKLVMELDGSMFASADGGSISLSGSLFGESEKNKIEPFKMFVLESFSRDYRDYEKNVKFTEIIQRRQTSNIKPDNNLLTISNFFNLYDDEIDFINVNFVTPLSIKAFDYYNFKLTEKNILDNRYIYVLKVTPSTDLFPAFSGIIKIVEGTYNIVELDIRPSETSAITFIDSLHIVQKFDEVEENVWHPALLEVTGKARMDIFKGIFDVNLAVKASSIYSEMEVNIPLPDSIYNDNIKKLTVAPLADSSKIEYWEKNALRDISDREKEMYVKVDSLVAKADSAKEQESAFNYNYNLFTPYFDFNRVSSVSIGLSPSVSFKSINLSADAAFSFGLQKPVGSLELSYPVFLDRNSLRFSAGIFSNTGTIGYDNSFPMIVNTLFAAFFHNDYYDYFKSDGWQINGIYRNPDFTVNLEFQQSRQFSLNKSTDRAIFVKKPWRENPAIVEGSFMTLDNTLTLPAKRWFSGMSGVDMNFTVNYLYGMNVGDEKDFNRTYANMEFKAPTFYTGYKPLELSLFFEYGKGKDLPLQYQHKAKSSLMFISKFGIFCTMPYSIYEKDSYFSAHIKYNLTDIWWRWIGLPLYEGRGLDLILRGSTGKFKTAFNSKEYYSEAGFGFERIPTFVSNVFYFGAGAVWGVGPIASGKSNWYLDITFPF